MLALAARMHRRTGGEEGLMVHRLRLTTAAVALAILPALAGAAWSADDTGGARAPSAGPMQARPTDATKASAGKGRAAKVADAPTAQGPSAAPFNPRWVAPKVQVKGLLVWVFTPGHFQRD
jgi:hypothetical protein